MSANRTRSGWPVLAVRVVTVGAVIALVLALATTSLPGEGARSRAVRVAVQVLATPSNGATGRPRGEVPRILRVGERLTAFLGAGDQGDLSLVAAGDTAASVDGFDHRWEVQVSVAEADADRAVLDVTWRRFGDATDRRHAGVVLREDEDHVLDLVSASLESRSSAANALVRVTASAADTEVGPVPLLEYELWLVHDAPGRASRVERITATARAGELLPYHFKPLHWSLSRQDLEAWTASSVQMEVGGSLRGRVRGDGTVDVELRTTRMCRWGEGGAGGAGAKSFAVPAGETVAVQLPAAAGVAVGSGRERVDFAEFFAGQQSTVFLTVRHVR
jgi:hypothetical protein